MSEMGGVGATSRQVAPLHPRFCPRLIRHTKGLMESEEKLCVKVLRTLQQMLLKMERQMTTCREHTVGLISLRFHEHSSSGNLAGPRFLPPSSYLRLRLSWVT